MLEVRIPAGAFAENSFNNNTSPESVAFLVYSTYQDADEKKTPRIMFLPFERRKTPIKILVVKSQAVVMKLNEFEYTDL